MRIIVIGDIHGCLEEFRELLALVDFRQGEDRLVLTGDLMDRGPDPVGCVRLAQELGAECVLSNHEESHLRWNAHEARRIATGKKNPMRPYNATRAAQNAALSEQDVQWIKGLPTVMEIAPNLLVCHAGLEPAFSANQQTSAVIRVRYVDAAGEMVSFEEGSLDQPAGTEYWAARWPGPESVIYGHAVHSFEEPRIDRFEGGHCYGIDLGCCFGGSLCAAVLEDGSTEPRFVTVRAKQTYYSSAFYHGAKMLQV